MKKPVRLAVALKYDDEKGRAPEVLASGKGDAAEKIIKKAEEEGIHLYEDKSLAQILSTLEIGTEVPPELYEAVAQVIAFVWQLDSKYEG
jgi:flagellar biosynthesis protein